MARPLRGPQKQAEFWQKKGQNLAAQGDYQRAKHFYQQILTLYPQHAVTWYNLGEIDFLQGDMAAAQEKLSHACNYDPGFTIAWDRLGQAYAKLLQFEKALEIFLHVRSLDPQHPSIDVLIAYAHDMLGHSDEAQKNWQKAYEVSPTPDRYLGGHCTMPAVLQSVEHEKNLESTVLKACQDVMQQAPQSGYPDYMANGAFYIAYHQGNIRPIQEAITAAYAHAYPDMCYEAPHVASWKPGEKIKLGVASSMLKDHRHSMYRTFKRTIDGLNQDPIEVVIFDSLPMDYQQARQIIAEAECDILFYPDILMDQLLYFLSYARLAPIQCISTGHPVTTGLKSIDYYLSVDTLELPEAQEHYTEKLVNLTGVASCYEPLDPPATRKSPSDLGLPEGKNIYACPVHLFKIHPVMDQAFEQILAKDPDGIIVVVNTNSKQKQLLQQRWQDKDFERIIWLEMLPFDDFMQLIMMSSVVLDTFPFGGGNTIYMSLSLGTPVITKPEPYMRGRAASHLYSIMGIKDCITKDIDDYVTKAVTLANDPTYLSKVCEAIAKTKGKIFLNDDIINSYREFFRKIVQQ
ncbi:MAG: tetratricopeptide repeat protein [Alphaproteobacteria bacterium]